MKGHDKLKLMQKGLVVIVNHEVTRIVKVCLLVPWTNVTTISPVSTL